MVNTIYRGLSRLLISFTLPQNHRNAVASFASKRNKALQKFPVSNSMRSLLALGLLVACVYSEDETKKDEVPPSQEEKFTILL